MSALATTDVGWAVGENRERRNITRHQISVVGKNRSPAAQKPPALRDDGSYPGVTHTSLDTREYVVTFVVKRRCFALRF